MGARHAKWFVTSAKTTGLAARDRARPEDAGRRQVDQGDQVRDDAPAEGQGAAAVPAACRRRRPRVARRSTTSSRSRVATAPPGSCRARTRSCSSSTRATTIEGEPDPPVRRPAARSPTPYLPDEEPARRQWDRHVKRVAYYKGCLASPLREGARHLDAGARAEARLELDRARVGDVLRRGRHPRGRAGLLPAPERAHPRVRGGHRARHADDGLQRLHAQPAAGEPPVAERRGAPRTRERQPRGGRRAAATTATSRCMHFLWLVAGESFSTAPGGRAQGAPRSQDRTVLRLSDPAPFEAPRLRRPGQPGLARADHHGVRRRADRLPGQGQVLRLPDHPGARGDGARRADPADRAGEGGRCRRDRDPVPAVSPLARRLAVEAQEADRQGLPDADLPSLSADRCRRRPDRCGAAASNGTSYR